MHTQLPFVLVFCCVCCIVIFLWVISFFFKDKKKRTTNKTNCCLLYLGVTLFNGTKHILRNEKFKKEEEEKEQLEDRLDDGWRWH